jgi:hypothetical protein
MGLEQGDPKANEKQPAFFVAKVKGIHKYKWG